MECIKLKTITPNNGLNKREYVIHCIIVFILLKSKSWVQITPRKMIC
jgi:hypothetical protein